MKVSVIDSKLRKHSVDVDEGASVAHVKLLLANMSLVPSGFVPELVYQRQMLSDDQCVGGIGYSLERNISLVCVRSTPASTAAGPEIQNRRADPAQPTESNTSATAQKASGEERAAELLLSGRAQFSENSNSAPAKVEQSVCVGAAVVAPAPVLGSYASAAAPSSASSSDPPPPAINCATEWLDEHGHVCPKAVDYATQCPKGHALVAFTGGGCGAPAQRLICRVCHAFSECERASQWLICSATQFCAGYVVCDCCASAVQQAPAAVAAGEGSSTLVMCNAAAAGSHFSSFVLFL
jgi:hypothetical protein